MKQDRLQAAPSFSCQASFAFMEQEMFKFHVHWKHKDKLYVDELSAASKVECVDYFNDNKRPDVSLVRVELVGPDEGGAREFAHSPTSPFSPLIARRRLDIDEDAR